MRQVLMGLGVFASGVFLAGCGTSSGTVSNAEITALSESVFENPAVAKGPSALAAPETFQAENSMTDVSDSEDARVPNLPLRNGDLPQFVQRCRPESYEEEKRAALAMAQADPSGATIPVRFQISVGTAYDSLAHHANQRSILRADDDGVTPIPVAPMTDMSSYNGARSFHYVADHSGARREFLSGKKCYFSTVKAVRGVTGAILNNSKIYDHALALMYYGVTYKLQAGQAVSDLETPRLFGCLPGLMNGDKGKCQHAVLSAPQFITLYVADLREESFGLTPGTGDVIRDEFIKSSSRNREYQKSFKEIFDLKVLFTHRDKIARSLMQSRQKGNLKFSGIEGTPQLIDNIIFGSLKGTVMATQYTPVVLDLGARNVKTSSLDWGTFFNLANLRGPNASNVSHLSAWLSGPLTKTAFSDTADWVTRSTEDGFLVRVPAGNTVQNASHLFSAFTQVDGKSYPDGFQALRALTSKDCTSQDVRRRYFGPWDAAYRELQVWVDRDRNGVAEADELRTLSRMPLEFDSTDSRCLS